MMNKNFTLAKLSHEGVLVLIAVLGVGNEDLGNLGLLVDEGGVVGSTGVVRIPHALRLGVKVLRGEGNKLLNTGHMAGAGGLEEGSGVVGNAEVGPSVVGGGPGEELNDEGILAKVAGAVERSGAKDIDLVDLDERVLEEHPDNGEVSLLKLNGHMKRRVVVVLRVLPVHIHIVLQQGPHLTGVVVLDAEVEALLWGKCWRHSSTNLKKKTFEKKKKKKYFQKKKKKKKKKKEKKKLCLRVLLPSPFKCLAPGRHP